VDSEPTGDRLTPDELDLLRRARAESLRGVTFDVEAGLADLRTRIHRPAVAEVIPLATRRRPRFRTTVAGLAAVFAAVVGGIYGVPAVEQRATVPNLGLPVLESPSPRAGAPRLVVETPRTPGSKPARPSEPAPSRSPSPSATPPASPSPSPSPSTAASPSPSRPSPSPSLTPSLGPSGEPSPGEFPMRYAATTLTMAVNDERPQSIDLDEPRTVPAGTGAVSISTAPGTGDLLMEPTADVQAATISAASATADECAAAIRDAPTGGATLTLRDDRTYCLLTPGPPATTEPDRPTLVQLTVDQPATTTNEITVHLTAWNLTP
jgi:hypothetical protein